MALFAWESWILRAYLPTRNKVLKIHLGFTSTYLHSNTKETKNDTQQQRERYYITLQQPWALNKQQ